MTIRPSSTITHTRLTLRDLRLTPHGFTMIEIIVILAVISILVAIMTPTVLKYIAEAQLSTAEEDVKTINMALNDLIKDTRKYPGDKLAVGKKFLCGPGTKLAPGTTGWALANGTDCSDLANHLMINDPDDDGTPNEAGDDYPTTGKRRWKGPYLQAVNEDPWGNAYEVDGTTLKGGTAGPTWVISGGPGGVLQTSTTATALSGDDVGTRIQ